MNTTNETGGIESKMREKLQARAAAGSLRKLRIAVEAADFCSNDYLGLARSPELAARLREVFADCSQNGSGGSRLLSGNSRLAEETETFLADFFRAPAGLFFSSGYAAESALISTIAGRNDTIITDELIHAGAREGCALSPAKRFIFKHNEPEDLEKKLQKAQGNIFVLTESLFSMDGDFAPLKTLSDLCRKYRANLILDEAHSGGVYGPAGRGIAVGQGLEDRFFARIYTFGKGFGVQGACIVGSELLKNYLVNFARGFIYTTAPAPQNLLAVREAVQFAAEKEVLREKLQENIRIFRQENAGSARLQANTGPIQVLKIGGNERTKAVAGQLKKAGFDLRPVLSPTVAAGHEIIRICLHAFNSPDEIQRLAFEIRLAEKHLN